MGYNIGYNNTETKNDERVLDRLLRLGKKVITLKYTYLESFLAKQLHSKMNKQTNNTLSQFKGLGFIPQWPQEKFQ